MKKGLKLGAVAAVLLGAMSSQVYALDCDGSTTCALDTTSTGNFDITYIKGSLARIWGLSDLAMTDTHLAGAEKTQDICVFSNKAVDSNTYELEVTSANDFTLTDGTGGGAAAIAYKLKVEGIGSASGTLDETDAVGANKLVASDMEAGPLAQQPDPSLACANQNARISLWFTSAPSLSSGAYSDTITMLVTPQ
ncbi:hypothetical protein GCM10023116_36560 [Kistimonas scapharcae]|uniref:Spore coat protein U domain-containing protein n=1 Tax=Kistimonas scapharcae TaxID=1036133 RepID=A0ABP8V655_9GAMM